MAARARPASSTPEDTMDKLSELTGVPVPGDGRHAATGWPGWVR
jgi:hypothetical protein